MDIDHRHTNQPTDRSSREPEWSGMPAKKSTREAAGKEGGKTVGRSGLVWSVPSAILPAAAGEVTELSEPWRRWRQRVVPRSASVYEIVLRPLTFAFGMARISKLQKSAIVCCVCTPNLRCLMKMTTLNHDIASD